METLYFPIEHRQDDSRLSPGRLRGVLMRYGSRARDRAERFLQDALSWPDGGVVLNMMHRRDEPIVRFTPVVEGRDVLVDAVLPDTSRGRDAAEMVRNGTFTGISLEFRALRESRASGVREISRAELVGAALVDQASYPASGVSLRGSRRGVTARTLWL